MPSTVPRWEALPIELRLGHLEQGSVAPAVFGLVDRGLMKRPELAAGLGCQIELRMTLHPPVRISFARGTVLVEDASPNEPPAVPAGREGTVAEVALEPEEDDQPPPAHHELNTMERAAAFSPDLVVTGSLPDIVAIIATPMVAGLPSLRDRRGRSALASVAAGRVRFRGSPRLVRRLLRLLQI
jgi:hypothetical protein